MTDATPQVMVHDNAYVSLTLRSHHRATVNLDSEGIAVTIEIDPDQARLIWGELGHALSEIDKFPPMDQT